MRLRVTLRLATDLELLGASQHRFAIEKLDEVGRMLGGYRKKVG